MALMFDLSRFWSALILKQNSIISEIYK